MKKILGNLLVAATVGLTSPHVGANQDFEGAKIELTAGSPELKKLCDETAKNVGLIINRSEVCVDEGPTNQETPEQKLLSEKYRIEYSEDNGKTWIAYVAGISVIALGGLAIWRLRKRKQQENKEDSDFLDSEYDSKGFGDFTDTVREDSVDKEDSINESGEINYAEEAIVWLTFGRFTEAEELIKQGFKKLEKEDNITERIKLNLLYLELYKKSGKKVEFENLYQQVLETLSDQLSKEDKKKVNEMGKEIDSTNLKYSPPILTDAINNDDLAGANKSETHAGVSAALKSLQVLMEKGDKEGFAFFYHRYLVTLSNKLSKEDKRKMNEMGKILDPESPVYTFFDKDK